jgi:WD40 repeat protein
MGAHSIAFSPDARRIAVGSTGSEAVKLWDAESWQELLSLHGQGSLFRPVAFSADDNMIGSCNNQGQLHIWRARPGGDWGVGENDGRESPIRPSRLTAVRSNFRTAIPSHANEFAGTLRPDSTNGRS